MQPIQSSIEGMRGKYGHIRERLEPEGFVLANWEYDGGYLDRQLDEQAMVFLRLPIQVLQGELDNADAWIQFGTPFVLKHIYQTGIDPDIGYSSGPQVAALVNQFQEPEEKDAPIEDEWVERAQALVREIEQRLLD